MFGAKLEDQAIQKKTIFQAGHVLPNDVSCDGSHVHLHLRGVGPGGSRTAQAAMYPEQLCDDILDHLQPIASDGGSFFPKRNHNYKGSPETIVKAHLVLYKNSRPPDSRRRGFSYGFS